MATIDEIQAEVAAELEELDRLTDALIAQFGKAAQRVQAGQLAEGALIQKALSLQAKMMSA